MFSLRLPVRRFYGVGLRLSRVRQSGVSIGRERGGPPRAGLRLSMRRFYAGRERGRASGSRSGVSMGWASGSLLPVLAPVPSPFPPVLSPVLSPALSSVLSPVLYPVPSPFFLPFFLPLFLPFFLPFFLPVPSPTGPPALHDLSVRRFYRAGAAPAREFLRVHKEGPTIRSTFL